MNRTNRTTVLLIAMIAILATVPFNLPAQGVPGTINYQGQLLDNTGSPVTTTITLSFTLWDAPTSGTNLLAWNDNDDVLPDANGIYSTEIGDDPNNPVPASILSSNQAWLQVNISVSGGGADEDLSPRSRLLSVPYAISANTLNGESYLTVATTSNPALNGFFLIETYNAAKALTPHGAVLSATNRATVIVPPGNYNMGTGALTLDTEFVDLVGLSSARDNQYIFGLGVSDGSTTGVLRQTANNVRIKNLVVECTRSSGGTTGNATDAAAYFPEDAATTATVIRNCEFKADDTNAWSMRTGINYNGTYIDCEGSDAAFGGLLGIASGTFINCSGDTNAFGGLLGTASGTFEGCTGGDNAFGGTGGTASGTFTNCTGGFASFGGIGGTASGTFTNCIGGLFSFGGAGTTAGGKFYFCKGGLNSIPANATALRRYCDVDGAAIND